MLASGIGFSFSQPQSLVLLGAQTKVATKVSASMIHMRTDNSEYNAPSKIFKPNWGSCIFQSRQTIFVMFANEDRYAKIESEKSEKEFNTEHGMVHA
jgi:hypothetical protein